MRSLVVLAIGGLALAATLGGGRPAAAGSDTGFSLVASAGVAGIHPIATGAPLLPGGDLGTATPSSAQAAVNSQQTSQAFASAPYGGDFVTTLPGTVDGLGAGSLPPVPSFPFYIATESPTTPSGSFVEGPYSITAASTPTNSTATAKVGLSTDSPQVASAIAHADVNADPTTGVLTADAMASIEPLQVAPGVALGDIHSSVSLRFDPSDPKAGLQKQSSLTIGTIDVDGLQVGLTDHGLTLLPGLTIPVDLTAVSNLLRQAGVTFTYLPGTTTATSVTSAAVSVSYTTTLPTLGLTTVTMLLGQVSASIDTGTTPGANPTTGAGPVGATGATTPPPSPAATTPTAESQASGPVAGGPSSPVAQSNGTQSESGTEGFASPPASGAVQPALPVVSVARFYPILVIGAAAALLVSKASVAGFRVPHRDVGHP
jgi:hypothetical protein